MDSNCSDDKKKIHFADGSSQESESIKSDDDLAFKPRSRQVSFVWNHGFNRMDIIKRRQSLLDPRELQRKREFSGLRFFGETHEFTDAKEEKESGQKQKIIRRHSFDSIHSFDPEEKHHIINRATFATRYLALHPHECLDSTSSEKITSDSSDSSSFEDNRKRNVVYRLSFADPERVEAIQALLSKSKQSIVVHQRPPNYQEECYEKVRAHSAVRIYHTVSTSSEEKCAVMPCNTGESSDFVKRTSPLTDDGSTSTKMSRKPITTKPPVPMKTCSSMAKDEHQRTSASTSTAGTGRRESDERKVSSDSIIESQSAGIMSEQLPLRLAPLCGLL